MSVTKESAPSHHEDVPHHRAMTTITLTPEQFETLYLQPRTAYNSGDNRRGLGNPTPIGMASFLLSFTPLAMDLLSWRGANAFSTTTLLGSFYAISGIGLWISCIMEWVMGNTFPSLVFGSFGGFWISYGILIQPTMEIAASFAPGSATGSSATIAAAGAATPAYNSGIAFFIVGWIILGITYFFASLRTNVPFVIVFVCLNGVLGSLAAGYFHTGAGETARAAHEFKAAGAFALGGSIAGWWVTIHLILASTGWPYNIPLFDLSERVLVGKRERDVEKGMKEA